MASGQLIDRGLFVQAIQPNIEYLSLFQVEFDCKQSSWWVLFPSVTKLGQTVTVAPQCVPHRLVTQPEEKVGTQTNGYDSTFVMHSWLVVVGLCDALLTTLSGLERCWSIRSGASHRAASNFMCGANLISISSVSWGVMWITDSTRAPLMSALCWLSPPSHPPQSHQHNTRALELFILDHSLGRTSAILTDTLADSQSS